jgi:hypothetical protein
MLNDRRSSEPSTHSPTTFEVASYQSPSKPLHTLTGSIYGKPRLDSSASIRLSSFADGVGSFSSELERNHALIDLVDRWKEYGYTGREARAGRERILAAALRRLEERLRLYVGAGSEDKSSPPTSDCSG